VASGFSRKIYVGPLLSPADCRRIRARIDAGVAEPAEVLQHAIAVDAEARHAASIDVDPATLADVERRLDSARGALEGFFNRPLARREGAGFLRYHAGGFYRPHVDRAPSAAWPDAARRQIAVVLFLNDGFEGGALHIIDAQRIVTPRAGALVAFDAGLLHEVTPVLHGTRDTVVDWFY
jgi:predicted 2-oxoglutarate/Fe(II)-dependent dioxygenase YbiX